MTNAEKSVFNSLKTEEDRNRFLESFWKVRDPNLKTPINEYRQEFYKRRQYSESELEGSGSDRGRIHIILGEPRERIFFTSYEEIVDCELWIYKIEGKPRIPPFLYLLFYRPNNFGKFVQFHPGIHSALDILAPNYLLEVTSKERAYTIIKRKFSELAEATLSIIPGESVLVAGQSMTSSGSIIGEIFSMHEREVDKNYLKNYTSVEGIVDVIYSANELGGKGFISLSENKGFKFLNYSIIPDAINMTKTNEGLNIATIRINLSIEDLTGKTIHQQERNINLAVDDPQNKAIEERKIVFRDFAPIINGEFIVIILFSNENTEEFFIHKERINITDQTNPVLIGFKIKEVSSEYFMPFCTNGYKVLTDPRLIFNKNESIEGLIYTQQKPHIQLKNAMDQSKVIEINNIVREGNFFVFKFPLMNVSSANYYLTIENYEENIYEKIISVMPYLVEKPIEHEISEPPSSIFNYIFVMAQQYFNKDDVDTAIEYFEKLPDELRNSTTLPVIARAYYSKRNYEKVVNLLERECRKELYCSFASWELIFRTKKIVKGFRIFRKVKGVRRHS